MHVVGRDRERRAPATAADGYARRAHRRQVGDRGRERLAPGGHAIALGALDVALLHAGARRSRRARRQLLDLAASSAGSHRNHDRQCCRASGVGRARTPGPRPPRRTIANAAPGPGQVAAQGPPRGRPIRLSAMRPALQESPRSAPGRSRRPRGRGRPAGGRRARRPRPARSPREAYGRAVRGSSAPRGRPLSLPLLLGAAGRGARVRLADGTWRLDFDRRHRRLRLRPRAIATCSRPPWSRRRSTPSSRGTWLPGPSTRALCDALLRHVGPAPAPRLALGLRRDGERERAEDGLPEARAGRPHRRLRARLRGAHHDPRRADRQRRLPRGAAAARQRPAGAVLRRRRRAIRSRARSPRSTRTWRAIRGASPRCSSSWCRARAASTSRRASSSRR